MHIKVQYGFYVIQLVPNYIPDIKIGSWYSANVYPNIYDKALAGILMPTYPTPDSFYSPS